MMAAFSRVRFLIVCLVMLTITGCAKKNIKTDSKKTVTLDHKVSSQNDALEKDDSGKERVISIASAVKRDVVPANNQLISYAQVKNIEHDLNLAKIAECFDCKTVMGTSFLIETLQRPVTASDQSCIINYRKDAILKLVENEALRNQVGEILQNAAVQEKEIIQLMSDYFRGKTCPELVGLELLKKQKSCLYSYCKFCCTSSSAKTYMTALNIVGLIGMPALSILCGVQAYQNAQMGLACGELAFWSGFFGLATGLYAYIVHDDLSKAGEKRIKLHALNQLLYGAEKIEQLCNQYQIKNQFKMSLIRDDKGIELVKGLKHCRYKKDKNYCFHTPGVHSFLYKIYENDQHLAQMFASIAEMDVYHAIATKIVESKQTENKFCFAQFIQDEKPIIKATAFWNVLVEKPVVNDFIQDRHIILTGPNAGGKTTSIRAILQNIILAQSYGVAAAETFELTQFDAILSYLNISDDLVHGDSLFASEIKRAQEILQIIKGLSPDQKLFFALDELFTGTSVQEGEKCAYEFIKKISTFDHVLSMYATHFNLLKELGNCDKALMSYKVDAPIKDSESKLVYPYTLSQGSSDVCVALDMARQANLFE